MKPSILFRHHSTIRETLELYADIAIVSERVLTKGRSISRFTELYMSTALNWLYHGNSGYTKRIEELQKQNKHTAKNDWEDTELSIGFY